MKLISFLLALMWGVSMQAQAEAIYKWRDDTGKFQYTEVPPPSGDYEVLNKPPPPTEDPGKVMENLQSQVQEAEKARQETEQQEKQEAENKDRAELIAKNCEVARNNVKALEGNQPVVRTDAQGNRIVLGTEEREATLKKARKDMEYYCNP